MIHISSSLLTNYVFLSMTMKYIENNLCYFHTISVTIVSSVIMAVLFVIEFHDFTRIHIVEELSLDTSRVPSMTINFDVTFPVISCPCEFFFNLIQNSADNHILLQTVLSVDVVDSSGDHQFGVEHNIFKQRLNLDGAAIEEAEQDTINKQHNVTETSTVAPAETAAALCLSCYGAREGCCNQCADVRDAYRQKNWAFHAENFEQCRNEKASAHEGLAFKEGCRLYGSLQVNRVGGSFHIAPGKSYSINHVHGE